MMSDYDKHSRINKFEKRRKNTKSISILMIVGILLVLVLLCIWIFGGSSDNSEETNHETNEQNEGQADSNENGTNSDESSTNEGTLNNDDNNVDNEDNETTNNDDGETDDDDSDDLSIPSDDVDTEEIDNPEDGNVVKAFTGDWEAIGTSQSEPHEVTYDTESQDWTEMEEAIKYAIGLDEMITQRIRNGGDQKVIGTVSTPDDTIYRVYLTWQTNEGWQPEKVEILRELDKNKW